MWSRLPRPLTFLLVAFLTYVIGFGIAFVGGVSAPYWGSLAFGMGAIGVAWVFSSIPPRARRIDVIYSDAIHAFDDSPPVLVTRMREIFRSACDWRWHAAVSAVLFTVFAVAAFLAFFSYPVEVFGVPISSLRPSLFAANVYIDGGGVPGFVCVLWFAALIAAALGSAGWLMIGELRVLPYLASRALPPLPEAVRAKLRGVADFHVQIARDWSIGALLFVALFVNNPDAASIAFILAILCVAVVMFFVPQVYLRQMVLRAHRRATDIALSAWQHEGSKTQSLAGEAELVASLSEVTTQPSYWVYGSGQLAMWFIAQATAVIALGIQVLDVLKPPG